MARAPKRAPARGQTRKQKALATRRRMVRAAYELFCEHGYVAATMDAIAERAGVAVQTLYFTFNSKGAMLSEALGAAIVGFDRWDPRVEPAVVSDTRKAMADFHPWFAELESERHAVRALAILVDASMDIYERVAPLVSVMTTAAAIDPDVAAVRDIGERRRAETYRIVVDTLAKKKGGLKVGVSARRATDILLTLLSAETYQQLTVGRGWSRRACRTWLLDVLSQQLFG